jgi:hypothetical protein
MGLYFSLLALYIVVYPLRTARGLTRLGAKLMQRGISTAFSHFADFYNDIGFWPGVRSLKRYLCAQIERVVMESAKRNRIDAPSDDANVHLVCVWNGIMTL